METLACLQNEFFMRGEGWITADWAVAFIAICAAVTSILSLTGPLNGIRRAGTFLLSAGWLFVAFRVLHTLLGGGDPHIPQIMVIGLALVGAGQTFYFVGQWRARHHGGHGRR